MKKMTLALVAATALTLSAGAAAAQSSGYGRGDGRWTPIDQRQAQLNARIDAGVRSGDLTRNEAIRLRGEFNALANLEARYRVNGLSAWERSDLDRRFDTLSTHIRFERHDAQDRGWYGGRNWTDSRGRWVSIDQRKAQLEQRIDQGVRSGQLTRDEAARLRAEFNELVRVEQLYRRNGLSSTERAGLDTRFDKLAARIRMERRDDDRRLGYNNDDRRYGHNEPRY